MQVTARQAARRADNDNTSQNPNPETTEIAFSPKILLLRSKIERSTLNTTKMNLTSRHLPVIALVALYAGNSAGFVPQTRIHRAGTRTTAGRSATTSLHAEALLGDECLITPEGYGFSATTARILKEAERGMGYCRAKGDDRVIDVMESITNGQHDVALVFDDNKLLGLFTESDYIRVSLDSVVYNHNEE